MKEGIPVSIVFIAVVFSICCGLAVGYLFHDSINILKDKVEYKTGMLIAVNHDFPNLNYYFIFDDDSVFKAETVNYNMSQLKSFIGYEVSIKYFNNWGIEVINISRIM